MKIKYEGLQRFCYRYGRLGHIDTPNKPCEHPLSIFAVREEIKYGSWIVADPVKGPMRLFPKRPAKKSKRQNGPDESHWRCNEGGGFYGFTSSKRTRNRGESSRAEPTRDESAGRVTGTLAMQKSSGSPKALKVTGLGGKLKRPVILNFEPSFLGIDQPFFKIM